MHVSVVLPQIEWESDEEGIENLPKELTLDFEAEYVDDVGEISDIVSGLLEETYDCFVRSFQISEVHMTGLKITFR